MRGSTCSRNRAAIWRRASGLRRSRSMDRRMTSPSTSSFRKVRPQVEAGEVRALERTVTERHGEPLDSRQRSSTTSRAITALDPTDRRSIEAEVAGPAALFVAKAHKLNDRIASRKTSRIDDKDAADVVRLMQSVPAAEVRKP